MPAAVMAALIVTVMAVLLAISSPAALAHRLGHGAELPTGQVAARCADAATAFMAALAADQRSRAAWPFADTLRRQWSYRTGSAFRKQGIRTGELSDQARALAQALLRCGLSAQGYHKATAIMALDEVVRERAGTIVFNTGNGPVEMGQDWFWFTVFGDPAAGEPWGFQVEGHHLTLNFTVVAGRMAATPAFLGAWPARMESGPRAGFAPLAGEEDRARALMATLSPAQRRRAVLADQVPRGLFTSPERAEGLERFEGLPASSLDPSQRAVLHALVAEYVGNLDPALAAGWLERIAADGDRALHFAWMGGTGPGEPLYYRIHGPSVLIEFDHAMDITDRKLAPDPNHIHTLVRRPGADLGADLLARHYGRSPDHRRTAPAPLAGPGPGEPSR